MIDVESIINIKNIYFKGDYLRQFRNELMLLNFIHYFLHKILKLFFHMGRFMHKKKLLQAGITSFRKVQMRKQFSIGILFQAAYNHQKYKTDLSYKLIYRSSAITPSSGRGVTDSLPATHTVLCD